MKDAACIAAHVSLKEAENASKGDDENKGDFNDDYRKGTVYFEARREKIAGIHPRA